VRDVGEWVGEVEMVNAGEVKRGEKCGEFAEGGGSFEGERVSGVEHEDCFVVSGDVRL